MQGLVATCLCRTPIALRSPVRRACLHACSSKREPLGKGYVRGHQIPKGLGDATPFGVAIHAKVGPVQAPTRGAASSCSVVLQQANRFGFSAKLQKRTAITATPNNEHLFTTLCLQELDRAGQAKSAMFPKDHPSGSSRDPEDPTHPLYVTSHGAYAAGEQRHRHYDWDRAGLDPATHSFGEAASHSIMHASEISPYSMQRRLLLQQGCCQHTTVQQFESRQPKLHWQV